MRPGNEPHTPSPESPPWEPTACILCECNCGIQVQLGGNDGRQFARIRGDRANPVSKGYVCQKAGRLNHYQNSRDRLLAPMRRRPDGSFEEIDWDTAIREVAARLSDVRDRFGGESIFYYGGGGQGNHLPGFYARSTLRIRSLHPAHPGFRLPLQRARAGKDGGDVGGSADGRRPLPRRLPPLRGRGLSRQEPVAVARHPARPGHPARDREGPRALPDRDRRPAHRDRRPGRHLPPGQTRHRRLAAGGDAGCPSRRRPHGTAGSSTGTPTASSRCVPASNGSTSRPPAPFAGSPRISSAPPSAA